MGGLYQRVNVSSSGVQRVNVTQRKALGASTAVFNASLFDKHMAELAMGALRVNCFQENARLPE